MIKKTVALIPASGRGSRMLNLTEDYPKALLPLHNAPLISWHLNKLLEEGIEEVCITVGYKKEPLIEYVNRYYSDKMKIYYVEQDELLGLAHAVSLGIDEIQKHNFDLHKVNLFIILGDTIVQDAISQMIDNGNDFIGYYTVEDFKRWCLIQTNSNGDVVKFVDKPEEDPKTRKALIGTYFYQDLLLLRSSIDEIISKNVRIKDEYQLSSAMEIYMQTRPIKAQEFTGWYDCGDIESFSKTRKNIARHFNSIDITGDNTIVKRSSNESKIQKEVEWYLTIPNRLRVYVPQLIDYSTKKGETFYELEYVNFAPIHEMFLYTMPDSIEWEKLFKNIFNMIDRFKLYSTKARFNTELHLTDILITKTEQRLNDLKKMNDGYWTKLLDHSSIKINGKIYKNFPLLYPQLKSYVENKIVNNSSKFWQVIHGDLFFGNMLYDISSDTLKVIDPRGNFGVDGVYGDIRYDIAKLNHSIVGRYDFIVNGLYAITYEKDNEFEYILYDSHKHNKLEIIFREYVEKAGFNYEEVTFITAILFLSMIPLHAENFANQKMFYMKGIEILNRVL